MGWINAPRQTPNIHGFVYQITEKDTGKKYIGIKRFWRKKTLPPLKGKKNKRHLLVESNWREYNSSSRILQEKLEENPDNYRKEIIILCDSQEELKCREAWLQLDYYVSGNWNQLFNETINLRVRIRKK